MISRSHRVPTALAVVACLSLVAASCGDDDDDSGAPATTGGGATDTTGAHRAPPEPHPTPPAPHRAPPERTRHHRRARHHRAPDTTGAAGGEAFQVPTDNCPPEATEPLADGEPIKIGFIGPQTGPLAAFGVIGQGMKIYFDKINEEEGGVDGHPIELVVKDDAYDPAKSAPAVQEALEGDQIFASVFQVGTPNVAGTRQLLRRRVRAPGAGRHGLPELGRPAELPVDARRHPVVRRRVATCGSSSSRRSSRTPRRSRC